MKAIKGRGQLLATGKQQEQAGQPEEAALTYQRIVEQDPADPDAVARLLVIYRKMKEYRKELQVIDGALEEYTARDKVAQAGWLKEHPKAAGAGRAMLRKLGGTTASAFGVDPAVARLVKRRELVRRRVGGGRSRQTAGHRKTVVDAQRRREEIAKKAVALRHREEKAAARKKAAEDHRQAAAARRAEKEQEKAAAREKVADGHEGSAPSLFVILLRYVAPLEKIDAAMPAHLAFLDKHYKKGVFLVSGRQVPRKGGVIIAAGKDRAAIEGIMKQEPFLKRRLAKFEVVEFSASRVGKRWMKG
ncbi:YciI family protein [Puia sp.]|jgi:uncharacterized protein YciI|uniref:YciI family protein n=1 Tax=Puia sp. TaxID=2045100 RepID=UPI002F3E3F83